MRGPTRWTGVLCAVAFALVCAPAQAASPYAPPDRPGPPLSPPASALKASLQCPAALPAGREPVLLVPGTTLTPDINFSWNYERALTQRGIPWCAVELPGHAMADIQVAGEYVVHAIRAMHARSGAKVGVVGYSQGGMVPRWALRFWPDTRAMVDDVVGIDPSNHGTLDAGALCTLPCQPSIWQQRRKSAFLTALNADGETWSGIDYTVVYSRTDEVVVPNSGPRASSALFTGGGRIVNVPVQSICPLDLSEHLAMGTYDPVGWALVLDAITHPGPAAAARIPRSTCGQLFMPGVQPVTFAQNFARVGATAGQQLLTYPRIPAEPALAGYVRR